MQDSFLFLTIGIIGAVIGFTVRKKHGAVGKAPFISFIQTAAICVLVFVMSSRIGANEEIAGNLGTIGVYGLVSTVIIFMTTILVAYITRKLLGFDSKGKKIKGLDLEDSGPGENRADPAELTYHTDSEATEEVPEDTGTKESDSPGKRGIDKMAIFIIVFVTLGLLFGRLMVSRIFSDHAQFDSLAAISLKVALSLLMLFVGFELGNDDSGGGDFKAAGLRILWFPVATLVGAILGGIILFFILPVSVRESLAIASGFGWYSMAPVLIMDAGHMTASAISFVHNLTRELLSMLIVPFVARYVGFIEAACVPGSPSMDICLPVIERSTNSTTVVYAFITGFLVSGTVPILVPLFIGG